MAKKEYDITKTGYQSFKDLQEKNKADYQTAYENSPLAQKLKKLNPYPSYTDFIYEGFEQSPLQQSSGGTDYWGNSHFDQPTIESQEDYNRLGDIRAENQPWWSKIVNGTAKAGVLAATTILETAGLVYGIGQGIYNAVTNDEKESGVGTGGAFLHGLWDNPITNALKNANDFAEREMPNYYTQDEQEHPLAFRNIFSANTLGDKLIKNMGFMIGAFYGGIPASSLIGKAGVSAVKGVRAANLAREAGAAERVAQLTKQVAGDTEKLNKWLKFEHLTQADRRALAHAGNERVRNIAQATRATTQAIGAIGSAVNEGAIEAINNSNDWAKLENQKENDRHQQQIEAIEANYGGTEMELPMKIQEAQEHQNRLNEIEKGKATMGNADLLMNIPILTASNAFQFSKLYARGFDSTRKTIGDVMRSSRRTMGDLLNGYKVPGELAKGNLKTDKKVWKGVLSALARSNSEGTEEFLQRTASDAAGQMVSDAIDRHFTLGTSVESQENVNNYIMDFGKAFAKNISDEQAWDEYAVGAVSALFGMPVFGSQTKNAWLGRGKAVGVAGGLVGNLQDYHAERKHEDKLANYLNGRVKNPKFKKLYDNLRRTSDIDKLLNDTMTEDDKAKYKDLEFEKLFDDINAAASTGHLAEFLEMIDYNGEYDEKELNDIVQNTSKPVTAKELKERDESTLKWLDMGIESMDRSKMTDEDLKTLDKLVAERDKIQERIDADNYQDTREGPFINVNGEMDVQVDENGKKGGKMIEILERNRQHLKDTVNKILEIRNDIDVESDGRLTDEQINLLTKMRAKMWDYDMRSADMAYDLVTSLAPALAKQKATKTEMEAKVKKAQERYEEAKKIYDNLKKSGNKEDITKAEKNLVTLEKNLKKTQQAAKGQDVIVKLMEMLTGEKEATSNEQAATMKGMGNDYNIFDRLMARLGLIDKDEAVSKRHLNADEVQALLRDEYRAGAVQAVIKDSDLSNSTKSRLLGEVKDLHQLAYNKTAYNQKIREFLGKPNLINDAKKNAFDKLSQKERDNKADELSLRLKDAGSMSELDSIMRESEQIDRGIANAALQKAKQASDDDGKKRIDDYVQGRSLYDAFSKLAYDLPDEVSAGVVETAKNAWDDVLADNGGVDLKNKFIRYLRGAADALTKNDSPTAQTTGKAINDILQELHEADSSTTTRSGARKETVKKEGKERGEASAADIEALMRGKKTGKTTTPKVEKSTEPAIKSKDNLEREIADVIRKSDNGDTFTVTKLADIDGELKSDIEAYNKAHPDDPIDDQILGQIVERLWNEKLDDENIISEEQVKKADNSDVSEDMEGVETKRSKEMRNNLAVSFKSDHVTRWSTLDKNKKQPYSPSPDAENAEQIKAIQELLERYHAYSFVDNNFLGYVSSAYQKKNLKKLPVYFLRSTDETVDGRTVPESIIFLAIEWTKDAERAVREHAIGKDGKLDDVVKPVTIKGKKYQIVGTLGINSRDMAPEVVAAFGSLQSAIQAEVKDQLRKERAKGEGKADFVLDTKHSSHIDTIYTGRLDKKEGEKQGLYEVVSTSHEWKNGNKFHFGVNVNGNMKLSDEHVNRVDPSEHWRIGKIDTTDGAIVLYVPRADGQLYPLSVKRRQVGEWLDETVDGQHTGMELVEKALQGDADANVYIANIVRYLRDLLNPDAELSTRMHAKQMLGKYFILDEKNPIHFDKKAQGFTLDLKNRKASYIYTGDNVDDDIRQFFKDLAANKIAFSIPVKEKLAGREIIKAGIMETGIDGFYNYNANFTVTPINGNNEAVHVETKAENPPLEGHANITSQTVTITMDGKDTAFLVDKDGKVSYRDSKKAVDEDTKAYVLMVKKAQEKGYPTYKDTLLDRLNVSDTMRERIREALGGQFENVFFIHDESTGKDWLYVSKEIGARSTEEKLFEVGSEKDTLTVKLNTTIRNTRSKLTNSAPVIIRKNITSQLVNWLKDKLGIKVHGRAEMEKYLKEHGAKNIQEAIDKSTIATNELRTIGSNLMQRYGNEKVYGCVAYTANYGYICNYNGEGDYDILHVFELDNNIKDKYDKQRRGARPFNRLSRRNGSAKRKRNSNSYNFEERGTNRDDAGLDRQTPQGESLYGKDNESSSEHRRTRFIKTGWDGSNHPRYIEIDDTDSIETFETPDGEIYGFVTPDGEMYLDETKIDPEHPLHEYTHIWDRVVSQENPALWRQGVELMKQTTLWNDILNDEHYGKKWQTEGRKEEELEYLVASEVHARLTGKDGAKILDDIAQKQGEEGIVSKLRAWLLKVWKELKSTFSNWSQEELDKLTLNDFNHMTVRDFADAVNLKEAPVNTEIGRERRTVPPFIKVSSSNTFIVNGGIEALRSASDVNKYFDIDLNGTTLADAADYVPIESGVLYSGGRVKKGRIQLVSSKRSSGGKPTGHRRVRPLVLEGIKLNSITPSKGNPLVSIIAANKNQTWMRKKDGLFNTLQAYEEAGYDIENVDMQDGKGLVKVADVIQKIATLEDNHERQLMIDALLDRIKDC